MLNRRTFLLGTGLAATAPAFGVAAGQKFVIIAEGDSLTYGQDTSSPRTIAPINGAGQSRSMTPYPEALAKLLGRGHEVLNHGFPGDRTTEGLSRWSERDRANVFVLMYGTNDALNFGGHPSGGLSPDAYTRNLSRLVDRRKGARVILISPPPLQDQQLDLKLQPYRAAAQRVARARSCPLIRVTRTEGMWADSVHLSAIAYANIARQVAPLVR